MLPRSLAPISLGTAALFLMLGCGSLSGAHRSACEPARADTAGWNRETLEGATLLIPPEFRRPPPFTLDMHGPPPPGLVAWDAPPARGPFRARSIKYHWDTPVPLPGGYRAGSERLRERRECTWSVQGRTARVVTGWLPDQWGATGRTYHTVAAWSDVQPGVHLTVFARAESAAEQERLFAVFQSVRFP